LQVEQSTIFTQKLAPCTRILKLEPIREFVQWRQSQGHVCKMHIGYTLEDMKRRADATRSAWLQNWVLPEFLLSSMTRPQVMDALKQRGLRVPETYALHFPNANCIAGGGCVKGGKAYMQRMLMHYPHYYTKKEVVETAIRIEQYQRQRANGIRVADIKLYAQLRDSNSPSGHISLRRFREQYEAAQVSSLQIKLFTLDADGDLCGAECGVSTPENWSKAS
jgi:hypothetical protein